VSRRGSWEPLWRRSRQGQGYGESEVRLDDLWRSATLLPFAFFYTLFVRHLNLQLTHQPAGEMAAINNCTKILTSPEGPYKYTGPQALDALTQLSLYTTAEACPMVRSHPTPPPSLLSADTLPFSSVCICNRARQFCRVYLRILITRLDIVGVATDQYPLARGL
jgi:hypothetical protein